MKLSGMLGCLLLTGLVCSAGCTFGSQSTTTLLKDPGRLIGRPRIEKNVARVVCLWEPAQGTGVDGKPARGFAGQILFFGPGSDAACRVHGEVRVIEYDRYDPDDEEPVPLHTFTFTPEAWDVHRTEGSLGHSYSVFIPYMQKSRDPVNCGVKVEYVAADGRIVASEITEVMLPAKKSAGVGNVLQRNVARNEQRKPRVTQVSAPETAGTRPGSSAAQPESASQLETTTIALPRSVQPAR